MKDEFSRWYSDEFSKALSSGALPEKIRIDTRLTYIKPKHARWLIKTMAKLSEDHEMLKACQERSFIFVANDSETTSTLSEPANPLLVTETEDVHVSLSQQN